MSQSGCVWTTDDLPQLTDPATVARGRAYVRSGRVVSVEHHDDAVLAQVQGTELHSIRLGDRSWECDCPAGVRGTFCKHCVAALIAATEQGAQEDRPDGETVKEDHDPVGDWLEDLAAPDLLGLLRHAASQVAGVADLLAQEYLGANDDVTRLAAEVERELSPRRPFYDYGAANAYATQAQGLLDVLHDRSAQPSVELLRIVQRAIALTVRTVLRSDESSGYQGDQVRGLLDLHRDIAAGLTGALPRAERRTLATWLHDFRFAGKQDVFEVNIDDYADVLEEDGVARYRSLVEKSAAAGAAAIAVQYARGRLAVLDHDAEAIVRIFGGNLTQQHDAISVMQGLDQAGMPDLAVQHAELGLSLPRTHRARELVDRLVQDALERGDLEAAVVLRRDDFEALPGTQSFGAYRSAAKAVGRWESARARAEALLAHRSPREWIGRLLHDRRDDEAWAFATAHPDAASVAGAWETLCARHAATEPQDTLPVYRDQIESLLRTTDRRNYSAACRLLVSLRNASARADKEDEFVAFVAEVTEVGRRRPAFLQELRNARLIDADGAAV